MNELIETIGTRDAIFYGALAIILLLQLRISWRIGRIRALLDPKRDRSGVSNDAPTGKAGRYMREDTLAEFLERREKDGR